MKGSRELGWNGRVIRRYNPSASHASVSTTERVLMSNVRQRGGLDTTSVSTSSTTEASSASASRKVRKVLNVVRPRKLCTRFGREIGREKKHRVITRTAGRSDAHDSRMQGSAKSKGLREDGQSRILGSRPGQYIPGEKKNL